MLLSAVSVLVVAQSSSEIPEGLTNNPVHLRKLQNFSYSSATAILNIKGCHPIINQFKPLHIFTNVQIAYKF